MRVYEVKILKEEAEGYVTSTRLTPSVVKVNGEEIEYGITYNENKSNTILFTRTLMPGEIIQIEYETTLSKVVSKNPYSKNAIYPMFTSEVKFKFNHKYEFFVKADEDYMVNFQSKYDPYYSTVDRVRTDTGGLLDNVRDEIIANVIYDNSKLVIEKLGGQEAAEERMEEGVPMYVKNFVRYKTDIDLCYAIYLSKTGKIGSFKKKLGDLDVSNEVKLPYLNDMLSRFRELLKPNEDLVDGDSLDFTMGFVKAKQTAYPVASRGVF